jgi:hypothetical protein
MTDDLNDSYIFDSTHRLVRYYYTSKKEGSFYYDITYTDSMNGNSTSMKVITDSKDGSRYDFIRDEKNCLLRIEHYNADKGLVETYFSK